jgi:hypothetical protein
MKDSYLVEAYETLIPSTKKAIDHLKNDNSIFKKEHLISDKGGEK